jgi:hypothetical protein
MAKSKVTLDIMHGNLPGANIDRTDHVANSSDSTLVRSIFCNKEWTMEHADMKINQVVVLYLNADQVSRPPTPPIVSPCKGTMS